jgi:hypothetical protein
LAALAMTFLSCHYEEPFDPISLCSPVPAALAQAG